MSLDNYPPGASNDPNAPWNEKDSIMKTVKVLVSCIYSKEVEIEVPEDSDLTNEELEYEVRNQVDFTGIGDELSNWSEDELVVIKV